MAPEIFQGQKYTKASDIYNFGMIMWEFMTGRKPFLDRNHDAELIIEICDGLRPPPIITNAPEGYIDIMQECWHSDPNKRPTATVICNKFWKVYRKESYNENSTKIIPSSDIGPVKINNPGAIYKSRPLSGMIRSAMSTMSTRSLISRSIISEAVKRKFEDNQIANSFNGAKSTKKVKLIENENNDYVTKENEFELDIDINSKQYNDESK
ncbi:kinase-like domain-containing protein [Glomus cerebriforme]|uniref:Kinase-like domain-containing protein n=1 Tax=Glomus cerebriforme TaxID=658196 RepID=A0A397TKS5_9GLOM|nr:kinase-like domain-containing protein [Glomus cerebriforme]